MAQARSALRSAQSQPTLYDVSRLSGVSSATVSRVFSGRTPVSDEVRQRVMEVARQLSYEPSHAARALAGCSTQTLGTIFPEIASGFYADVLAGVDEVAAESGFDVLAAFVGSRRRRPDLVRRLSRQGRVDALVVLNLDGATDLDADAMGKLPMILVDREITGADLPVIGMDNVGGAGAVVGHLCEQGHRRIGIVTGPTANHDSDQRYLGFRQAIARLGLPFIEQYVWPGDFTREGGARAARECLTMAASSSLGLPDAIFCLNDLMAIGMLGEFERAGLRVPDNIALAGYDDIGLATLVSDK